MPDFSFAAANVDIALCIVPGGNPVAPPELAADAPVFDITHPGKVDVLGILRNKFDVTVFYRLNGRFGQRFDIDEPLVGKERFNHHAGALTPGHCQCVIINLFEQT